MEMSIERAVWEWLLECPELRELYFAAGRAGCGGAVLTPVSDRVTCRFLFACERQARFELDRFELLAAAPNDGTNLAAAEAARRVADWIEARDAEGRLPRLPCRCRPTAVTVEAVEGPFPEQGQSRATLKLLLDYLQET